VNEEDGYSSGFFYFCEDSLIWKKSKDSAFIQGRIFLSSITSTHIGYDNSISIIILNRKIISLIFDKEDKLKKWARTISLLRTRAVKKCPPVFDRM